MAHFVISYDLHKQRTYEPVWDRIEEWGGVRLLESVWVVNLDNTAKEVRDALNDVIDDDDSTAVIELKADSGWATMRAKKSGVDWMKENIS